MKTDAMVSAKGTGDQVKAWSRRFCHRNPKENRALGHRIAKERLKMKIVRYHNVFKEIVPLQ